MWIERIHRAVTAFENIRGSTRDPRGDGRTSENDLATRHDLVEVSHRSTGRQASPELAGEPRDENRAIRWFAAAARAGASAPEAMALVQYQ